MTELNFLNFEFNYYLSIMSGDWETVGKSKKSKTSAVAAGKTEKPLKMEDICTFPFVFFENFATASNTFTR